MKGSIDFNVLYFNLRAILKGKPHLVWAVNRDEINQTVPGKRAAKTSRALMLIAGDGHTNIFGPDVSSLDPKTWYETQSGQKLMSKLIEAKLLKNKLTKEDEPNVLKDDDLAWRYFNELQFDVILANPPFAGEMKDKKMLSHYDLGKPALKRAKDKAAKEERDVLFIERILKFLKPGGRAAIVLPQGKFNNSSLAFIREWILRKARLLAVVGLHQNTFKPHTGTKTSVIFVQKYTDEEIAKIQLVKQEVAANCPDYEVQIKELLKQFENEVDIPDENLPEAISEILFENFGELESEAISDIEVNGEGSSEEAQLEEIPELADLIDQAAESVRALRKELLEEKKKLENMESDIEALKTKAQQEIDIIAGDWKGTKKELTAELKSIKEKYKADEKELKVKQKEQIKRVKSEIKALEIAIPNAEYELKKLTNQGKLQILLSDDEMIGTLKERWIDSEVAKKLDYPIFMAVSEKGGKNNSGDYEYLTDEEGNYLEFDDGQPIIAQDLVNFELSASDLKDANSLSEDAICIAEAFVQFAQKYNFDFWRAD